MCGDGQQCYKKWDAGRRADYNRLRRERYQSKTGRTVRAYTRKEEPLTHSDSHAPEPATDTISSTDAGGETPSVADRVVDAETATRTATLVQDTITEELDNISDVWDLKEEDVDLTKTLAVLSSTSELASSEVEEIGWDTEIEESSNLVMRVVLKNGDAGYWKSFGANQDNEVPEIYKSDIVQSMNSEVIAYRFAQALGPEYADLVPETVIREVGGSFGSFQKEVEGANYRDWTREDLNRRGLWNDPAGGFPESKVRAAAIFDYLAGSQDRHEDNILVDIVDRNGTAHPVLIDNGLSFSKVEEFPLNVSIFTREVEEDIGIELSSEEKGNLQSLYDSPDSRGMKDIMPEESYKHFRERLRLMLDAGTLLKTTRPDEEDW